MKMLPSMPEIPRAEPHEKKRVMNRLLPEQTAIATMLSEMNGQLTVLEQQRKTTRALKQAMMQEHLTGRTRLV